MPNEQKQLDKLKMNSVTWAMIAFIIVQASSLTGWLYGINGKLETHIEVSDEKMKKVTADITRIDTHGTTGLQATSLTLGKIEEKVDNLADTQQKIMNILMVPRKPEP